MVNDLTLFLFFIAVPGKGKSTPHDVESMKPLMQMVFHCIDKVRKLKLSKEVLGYLFYMIDSIKNNQDTRLGDDSAIYWLRW